MATLHRAIMISTIAFDGVFDKGGMPFFLHQVRVSLKGKTEDERITGMLHDLVEDVDGWTCERLLEEGFAPHIVQAVDNLTRRKGETYAEFIERCCLSLLSINVKLYDLEDNMDINRLILVTDQDMNRMKRYHKARQTLLEAKEKWLTIM